VGEYNRPEDRDRDMLDRHGLDHRESMINSKLAQQWCCWCLNLCRWSEPKPPTAMHADMMMMYYNTSIITWHMRQSSALEPAGPEHLTCMGRDGRIGDTYGCTSSPSPALAWPLLARYLLVAVCIYSYSSSLLLYSFFISWWCI